MSETFKPKPTAYYVRAELENGGFTTITKPTAREALETLSQLKAQGMKVAVTEPGGVPVSEAKLQAMAAREVAN